VKAAALFKTHEQTQTDVFITFAELTQMAINPINVEKKSAPAIAPQLSGIKTKAEVIAFNQMSMLWIDIDTGNKSSAEIKASLIELGFQSIIIYASKSSIKTDKRWRVLIELYQPLPCKDWADAQEALQVILGGDSSAVRLQQILYAPNKGQHYEVVIIDGKPLHVMPLPMRDVIDKLRDERKVIHQKINAAVTREPIAGEFNIQSINDTLATQLLLEQYGYKQLGRKWLSPNSSSGVAGLVCFNDGRWFSHHNGDSDIGVKCEGGTAGDAFDLYTFYEHGGDKTKSLASLMGQLDPDANKRRRFEWAKKHGGSK